MNERRGMCFCRAKPGNTMPGLLLMRSLPFHRFHGEGPISWSFLIEDQNCFTESTRVEAYGIQKIHGP